MREQRADERDVMALQPAYFLATGIWPLSHDRSFEAITGRKHDDWLVHTVGALLIPVAATLALAAARRCPPDEARVLGAGSAVALVGVETYYALRGRIRWVYLADGVIEALLALALPTSRRAASEVA